MMVESIPPAYILPSSPSLRCSDRFSILDESHENEGGLVAVWPLLVEILKSPVTCAGQLISLLDTIATCLRGTSGAAGDYGNLQAFLEKQAPSLYKEVWPSITDAALSLPVCFSRGLVPVLAPGNELALDRSQARSLVAHQLLCTLREPPWRDGYYDFSVWYSSGQRHPRAAEMYLSAVFEFFARLPPNDEPVRYSLHSFGALDLEREKCDGAALAEIKISRLDRFSTRQQELDYQGAHGAVVVPANRHIGFGQSATQEEVYVGNAPEACPAVLFTPPLGEDEVLSVQGAAPMLTVTGQRRDITWADLPDGSRHGGRMLFMDALELDEAVSEGRPQDLRPENMERELSKAVAAFSSWGGPGRSVSTGLWGCGAFGGRPGVKIGLVWAAASVAGVSLEILCDKSQSAFADEFERFASGMTGAGVGELLRALGDMQGDEPLLRF